MTEEKICTQFYRLRKQSVALKYSMTKDEGVKRYFDAYDTTDRSFFSEKWLFLMFFAGQVDMLFHTSMKRMSI